MAWVPCSIAAPAAVWLLAAGAAGESACTLVPLAPLLVSYPVVGQLPDTIPANVPGVIPATGGTVIDVTLDIWLAYTVLGSGILSLAKEADFVNQVIPGTYAILARILRAHITEWQNS